MTTGRISQVFFLFLFEISNLYMARLLINSLHGKW